MREVVLLRWCFLLVWCWVVALCGGHVNHVVNHTHEVKKERLKERWGAQDIIRDMDHLKEDLQSIIELVDTEQLMPNELAFYLLRMHDFDDNGRLDGIEIRLIGQHSLEHYDDGLEPELRDQRLEQIIDDVLDADLDSDGFVDFGEFQTLFDKKRRRGPQDEQLHDEV